MSKSHSLLTVRNVVFVSLVISVAWVVSLFYSSGDTSAPLTDRHEQSTTTALTDREDVDASSAITHSGSHLTGSDNAPVFVNLNPSTYNLEDYANPEEILVQLGQVDIPPERQGSIGEFIDPEDDNYTYMELTPGSIGEVVDPNDESYVLEITRTGNIGEVIDPNDESIELEILNRGSVGDVVDPNEIY